MVTTCAVPDTNVNVIRLDVQLSEIQFALKVKNLELSTQVPAAKSSNVSVSHHNVQLQLLNALRQVTLSTLLILVPVVHHMNVLVTRQHAHQSKDHNAMSVNNVLLLMKMLAALNTLVFVIQPDAHNHQSAQLVTSWPLQRVLAAIHTNVSVTIPLAHHHTFQHAQMLLV